MDEQSRQYGQQNMTLPHDMVQLPSEGLFYKNKKKAVKVGYLTAADENILMGGGLDLTYNLLRSKLYEPDMKIEDMLEGDVEAILVFLRNTSFGPEYTLSATDPSTDERFKTTIVLDELNYKKTLVAPDEDGLFTTKLPVSGKTVRLKILNMKDKMEIDQLIDSYPSERTAPVITTRLNKQIVAIDGDTDRNKIATFIEQMPIGDSKFIRRFIFDNEPRLDLKKEVTAPSGEKVMIDITFGVEFFRPFLSV